MFKLVLIMLSVLMASQFAVAAQIEMICKNPRRAYTAVFNDKARTFRLRTAGKITRYRVKRVQKRRDGYVVRGKTVKGGPDFVAYLGRNRRIQFVAGGKVIQTDKCR